MAKTAKTSVFFIATKTRKEPVAVNFYTKKGKRISFDAVEKVKTKKSIHFYAKPAKR